MSGATSSLRRVVAVLASGVALALAFPDLEAWPLAWVALVPLLVVTHATRLRVAAGYGWLGGLAFFLVSLYWIPDTISNFTSISPLTATGLWVLMAAAAAYSFALFAVVVEALAARGASRVVTAPLVWVVVEWMRTFVIAGFPWNSLGYSQIEETVLVQIADLTSVYGISAAIVLTNIAIAEAWLRRGRSARAGGVGGAAIGAGSLVLIAAASPLLLFVYGTLRLADLQARPFQGALRVGVVQGNIAQDRKWDAAFQDEILGKYMRLSSDAADAGARLIVWPEAALPFYFRYDERSRVLLDFARERHVDMLVGTPGYDSRDGGEPQSFNEAWMVTSDGAVQGPYDKIQLVPFGEYIPLHGLFGMVRIAVESVGEFGRGTEYTIFETAPFETVSQARGVQQSVVPQRPARFGTLICYEGIFPELTRRFALAGADFLVNISNDAWYGDTAAPHQHLSMAALRTVENRMPMVRSTNTGISAFITAEGRMGPTTSLFEDDIAVETILTRPTWSFYRAYGDIFVYLCMAAIVALALGRPRRA